MGGESNFRVEFWAPVSETVIEIQNRLSFFRRYHARQACRTLFRVYRAISIGFFYAQLDLFKLLSESSRCSRQSDVGRGWMSTCFDLRRGSYLHAGSLPPTLADRGVPPTETGLGFVGWFASIWNSVFASFRGVLVFTLPLGTLNF